MFSVLFVEQTTIKAGAWRIDMKQMIDHCLTAFFMIISMVILIFFLLIIPTSWASAAAVSGGQVLVIR